MSQGKVKNLLPRRHRPITTAGPLALRKHVDSLGPPPPNWTGTAPEWIVYVTLLGLGKKPNVDFSYQSSVAGGRAELGGLVADFMIFDPPTVINVQGVHWHYGLGPSIIARDKLQRSMLESLGYTVVLLDADTLTINPKFYVSEALAGRDHSRVGRGIV